MLTIGFANHYYTLWQVTSCERYDAATGATYIRTNYLYLQNLSLDREASEKKVMDMSDTFDIDLTLRGEQGTRYFTERMIKDMPLDRFTFGKFTGTSMIVSTDVWQLTRAMNEEPNPRRRVIARRRLIELGELVRYEWQEKRRLVDYDATPKEDGTYPVEIVFIPHKYCPVKLAESIKATKAIEEFSGHFFQEGQRIVLSIKKIKQTYYETAYGTMWVQTFITPNNQVVKYKGSAPVNISDEFVDVKATIEHVLYNTVEETRLKRIKVL